MSIERYVPQGEASLVEDAPGWGSTIEQQQQLSSAVDHKQLARRGDGPVCWKCRGSGQKPQKRARLSSGSAEIPNNNNNNNGNASQSMPSCGVCQGTGRLPPKKSAMEAVDRPGMIRKARTAPAGWKPALPLAHALLAAAATTTKTNSWADWVRRADEGENIICTSQHHQDDNQDEDESSNQNNNNLPAWLPKNGEELVKLNGAWRILQRVGGHRWTTDDCVTAYVAVREAVSQSFDRTKLLRYLDLGTGNASVLQMVLRALMQQKFQQLSATGIEARQEAVDLARRSLLFNVGPDADVKIVHGDFRDVIGGSSAGGAANGSSKFDLITGTPPYFRVDFYMEKGGERVQSAVTREGAMPQCRSSAPARCEFRGGIEAYCQAASQALVPEMGRFVVCENYQNHHRVLQAAQDAGLQLLRFVKVEGRQGRKPLFCVYIMKMLQSPQTKAATTTIVEEEVLAVRDDDGNWTREYADNVFEILNIPNFAPEKDRFYPFQT